MSRVARLAAALAALLASAGCSSGDGAPAVDPAMVPGAATTVASATIVVPTGFESMRTVIRKADGTVCELCTYVAETEQRRERGLMAATGLDGRDGMIFVFDVPGRIPFWMKDTVMPLSAAWFGPDGDFIAAYDMTPCGTGVEKCPLYGPSASALHVLEVPQGDLARLGIGDGARLVSVGGQCPLA